MNRRFADAVIVAAGSSRRMDGRDKLDEALRGQPLLQWSIEAMARAESVDGIVVVARPDRVAALAETPWLEATWAKVVAGGAERSESVRAGVQATSAEVVLVHDGARPLASSALADAVARAALQHGAAVPVLPVVDSLKRAGDGRLQESVDRHGLVRTQTPQGARRDLFLAAFEQAAADSFTDEAALLEAAGVAVATVPGEATNIKVTSRADLELLRALVAGAVEERIGFGEDAHGFGPADGLMLGGTLMQGAPRLFGHSDGDVALHALATAILSACALGDLGRLYPADDDSTEGIAGAELVEGASAAARDAGWSVSRAQVSIVGARPRLGAERLDQMRSAIAQLLRIDADAVAVTASTGNLSGPEGAGRVIRATALVTVIRR